MARRGSKYRLPPSEVANDRPGGNMGIVRWVNGGYHQDMLSAIFGVITMVLGLIVDIITLPFRALFALLGGAEFEFRRFGRPRGRA